MSLDFLKIGITVPELDPAEPERIMRLLGSGQVDIFHLRKPEATEEEMRSLIESIGTKYRERLKLHSHFSLAKEYGLLGVHLNSRFPNRPDFYCHLSRSCHSFEELARCSDEGIYEYVTLSPVYNSISKTGYRQQFSPLDRMVATVLKGKFPNLSVIALGGVTSERFAELREAGFAGAAMLGALKTINGALKTKN